MRGAWKAGAGVVRFGESEGTKCSLPYQGPLMARDDAVHAMGMAPWPMPSMAMEGKGPRGGKLRKKDFPAFWVMLDAMDEEMVKRAAKAIERAEVEWNGGNGTKEGRYVIAARAALVAARILPAERRVPR